MHATGSKKHLKPGVEAFSAPGFLRRIGAVFYDALLLLAVLFFATAIVLPLNGGEAFAAHQYYFPAYLLGVSYVFFGWFWTHGGQTLGMRAWKIRLFAADGGPVTWRTAALRFAMAGLSWGCLGLGFLWCLIDKNHQAWHDHVSQSFLWHQAGEKNSGSK